VCCEAYRVHRELDTGDLGEVRSECEHEEQHSRSVLCGPHGRTLCVREAIEFPLCVAKHIKSAESSILPTWVKFGVSVSAKRPVPQYTSTGTVMLSVHVEVSALKSLH
jgi:hypothetical protein